MDAARLHRLRRLRTALPERRGGFQGQVTLNMPQGQPGATRVVGMRSNRWTRRASAALHQLRQSAPGSAPRRSRST